jgi:hypothetical protein
MPRYSITGPDGKTYSINGPEGASREEVISAIQQQQALQLQQEQEHLKKTGFMPAIKAAGRSALGAAEEALGRRYCPCKRKRHSSRRWCLSIPKNNRTTRWYCRTLWCSYCCWINCS